MPQAITGRKTMECSLSSARRNALLVDGAHGAGYVAGSHASVEIEGEDFNM